MYETITQHETSVNTATPVKQVYYFMNKIVPSVLLKFSCFPQKKFNIDIFQTETKSSFMHGHPTLVDPLWVKTQRIRLSCTNNHLPWYFLDRGYHTQAVYYSCLKFQYQFICIWGVELARNMDRQTGWLLKYPQKPFVCEGINTRSKLYVPAR